MLALQAAAAVADTSAAATYIQCSRRSVAETYALKQRQELRDQLVAKDRECLDLRTECLDLRTRLAHCTTK